jgi:hypothetical protein
MTRRKIAYLASADTMPRHPKRRDDAFEHDYLIGTLGRGLHYFDVGIEPVLWDDPSTDWSRYSAAVIGTTWDYTTRLPEFLARLNLIESQLPLYNPSQLMAWNARKTYLRDLADKGIACIPTLWLDVASEAQARSAFAHFNCEKIIIKPQVGANAWRQVMLTRDAPWPDAHALPIGSCMLQPFQPAIASEGEYSLLFFNRRFSHAVIKKPAAGDYRIQSGYGGKDFPHTPNAADLAAAQRVLDAIDGDLLYARVDMVRSSDGALLLIELELIEPYLYPIYAPDMGFAFAQALIKLAKL